MRKLIIISLIAIAPFLLKAQLTDFDLSSYKLPEIKRHQLNLNAALDGGNSYYDYYQKLDDNQNEIRNNIGGDFGISYQFYRSSKTYQGNQLIGITLGSSFADRKDEDGYVGEEFNFGNYFNINSENRFYLNGKFFLESDLSFSQRYSERNENYDYRESEFNNKDIRADITLGIGYGRIEEVQDAWLATYILNELQENGKLTRQPTEDDILEFSKLISQLKNERFLDARLQKIREIEEVDKFLQSKDLTESTDARYFTCIYDNWDNAATQIRRSGNRLSFLVTPYIYLSNDLNKYDYGTDINRNERNNSIYEVQAQLIYTLEKPINIYWQKRFSILLSGGYIQGSYESVNNYMENETDINSPQLNSTISYSLAYYPNSRTNLSLNGIIYFRNYFGTEKHENDESDINHLNITPQVYFNLNYYISPQLLFNASYSVNYNYTESNSYYYERVGYDNFVKRNQFNHYINIGFKYQIF